MPEIVTTGWHTTDDIVLVDGTCRMGVDGGGAVYSAIGARVWSDSVGIHAAIGETHAGLARKTLAAHDFATDGMRTTPGNGLELWMLHESDDFKQQIVKHTSRLPADMDTDRGPLPPSYRAARGFHIAPQGPQSGRSMVYELARSGSVTTMDILSDDMIDASAYADLSFLDKLTAFLPSEAEVRRIWKPASLSDWARDTSRQHDCHVIVKLGAKGALVSAAGGDAFFRVSALSVPVVDTTGAGDAFCGGFLAGLVAERSLHDCAAMGTVSAAFVIGACGALATDYSNLAQRDEWLKQALATIDPHSSSKSIP
jgi:ribokinase